MFTASRPSVALVRLSLATALVLSACNKGQATTDPSTSTATASVAGETESTAGDAATTWPTVSQDPVVQKIVELGHTESQVDAHLEYLTQQIGPRLTSSHNLMRAERWATEQFAAWGLRSSLEPWGSYPVGFDRGPWSGGMVAPDNVTYDFITRSWTPGLAGPHRGKAIVYPTSAAAAKKLGEAAEGAWIVVPPNTRREVSEKKREAIDAVLRKAKIAGFVHASRDAKKELVHTSGNEEISWDDLPVDVRVQLRGDQHEALMKLIAPKEGEATEVELEFSIHNSFFNGPVIQNNVIADIVGSEKPDEYVIVGGHIDSWDGAVGAVDNGTGVATTMEAARLLMAAGAKPKRTIRFMLWSGEEQGLFGSTKYVEQHPEILDKISAVLVHDGGTNFLAGLSVTPEMLEDAKQIFAPLLELNPDMPFHLRLTPQLQTGGSDHTPFARGGAPAFFWIQDGRADYDHAHHTQYDTLDAAIPEYQHHSAMVVAIAALQLANHERMLPRENAKPLARRDLGADFGSGFVVEGLEKGGAAKRAGIKKGDKLLHLAGMEGASPWETYMAMQRGEPKKELVIERKGKKMTVTLDWSGSPEEEQRAKRDADRKAKFGELEYGTVVWGAQLPKDDEKGDAKADKKADKKADNKAETKTDAASK